MIVYALRCELDPICVALSLPVLIMLRTAWGLHRNSSAQSLIVKTVRGWSSSTSSCPSVDSRDSACRNLPSEKTHMTLDEIQDDIGSLLIDRDKRFVLTAYSGSKLGLSTESIRFRMSKLRGIRNVVDVFRNDDLPEGIVCCLSFDMSDQANRDKLVDMVIHDHSLLLDFKSEVTSSLSEEIRP